MHWCQLIVYSPHRKYLLTQHFLLSKLDLQLHNGFWWSEKHIQLFIWPHVSVQSEIYQHKTEFEHLLRVYL